MAKPNRRGGARSNTPVHVRLAARLDMSDPQACWPYQGEAQTRSGHRQIWDRGRMRTVHRVAWEIANGTIPDGLCVLHRCDNPPCCNPAHLFLGTVQDNNADRDAKGRHVALKGEDHGSSRLTNDQTAAIRELLSADVPQSLIARVAGVSQSLISAIRLGDVRAMGLDALGHPQVELPKAQRDALAKVAWPQAVASC